MEAILISGTTKSNLKILKNLAQKLGGAVTALNDEQTEDFVFGEMLNRAKTGKLVSKEQVLEALRS